MIRLAELEKVMRSQFIWNHASIKKMETSEDDEGSKSLARDIFVGLSDVYGFDASDVCDYLDIGYDSYRHKLMKFREYYREGKRREMEGILHINDDKVKKFYIKVCLCMNSIKSHTQRDQYYLLEKI